MCIVALLAHNVVSATIDVKLISKNLLASWNEFYTKSLPQFLISTYVYISPTYQSSHHVVARSINTASSTAATTTTTASDEVSGDKLRRRVSKQPGQVQE